MEQKNYRVLLSEKQFLKLILANVVSRFGDSLDVIAYTWIMYEVTGSESLMALIMGLNYVPTVLLQPFAGAPVDRIKKKGLMVLTDVARFVIVAVFVTLYANGALTPLLIAILTLCTSTVEALRIPAGGAFMQHLLTPEHYTIAKAANYSLSQASQLIGLMLAGVLITWIGAAGVLWIDAATFAVSAIVIAWIQVSETRGEGKIDIGRVAADFKEGLSFLMKNKTVQVVSIIGLVIDLA